MMCIVCGEYGTGTDSSLTEMVYTQYSEYSLIHHNLFSKNLVD